MSKLVLSLFDGCSCGQVAISYFTKDYSYFASEIEPKPIMVTQHNFPDTVQLGNVMDIDTKEFGGEQPFILMGGSPCGDLSLIGKRKGMVTKCNIKIKTLDQYLQLKNDGFEFSGQSYLFWEYVRILKETKPKYFLLENVLFKKSLKEYEHMISEVLGVQPIMINSSTVSGQFRERLYWTNIPNVTQPENKGITIQDIIPDSVGSYGKRGVILKGDNFFTQVGTVRKDNLSNCLVKGTTTNKVLLKDGTVRQYTMEERELLQTLPIGYTNVPNVANKHKIEMTGNGWTIDVIKHILSFIPEFNVLRQVA